MGGVTENRISLTLNTGQGGVTVVGLSNYLECSVKGAAGCPLRQTNLKKEGAQNSSGRLVSSLLTSHNNSQQLKIEGKVNSD